MSDREPTVLAPRTPNNVAQVFGDIINQAVSAILRVFISWMDYLSASPSDIEYEDLDSNAKSIIDATIEKLKPEIEKKAEALITAEIRDRLAKHANLKDLSKALAKNKSVSLKRKKGCIYLQFGLGDPEDPIEEFLILMT